MSLSLATNSRYQIDARECLAENLVSDWLLSFNCGREIAPTREAGSQPTLIETACAGGLSMYRATTAWRGVPLTTVVEGDYQAWLIGEVFGTHQQISSE